MMVRWMCGTSLNRRISSKDLNKRLNVEAVADVVRLRWFGHVERKDSKVSFCRNFEVMGAKCRGRLKKTLGECVRQDLKSLFLKAEWAQDRLKWRGLIMGIHPTSAGMEKQMLKR